MRSWVLAQAALIACVAWGSGTAYAGKVEVKGVHVCCKRCQDAFDAGLPAYDPNSDRPLKNLPLSAWLLNGTRYFEPVLRGSKAWRKLGKSEEWAPVHKLKIRRKKPREVRGLQDDLAGPTDRQIGSDWQPSSDIDPARVPEIPSFLDRRPRADAPDESVEQPRRAA